MPNENISILFAQNVDGNTPLHVAIINQHISIIRLLIQAPNLDLTVRNRQNQTAFACSIVSKNNEAADLILKREPRAADQVSRQYISNRLALELIISPFYFF